MSGSACCVPSGYLEVYWVIYGCVGLCLVMFCLVLCPLCLTVLAYVRLCSTLTMLSYVYLCRDVMSCVS